MKSGGDREWGNRIFLSGLTLVHAPEVRVRHPARHSLFQLYWQQMRLVGGRFFLNKYNGKFWRLVMPTPSLGSQCQKELVYIMQVLRSIKYRRIQQKFDILLVWVLVKGINVIETIRLCCGGQPRR